MPLNYSGLQTGERVTDKFVFDVSFARRGRWNCRGELLAQCRAQV